MEVKKVLRRRKYKAGYEIRDEVWSTGIPGHSDKVMKRVAYNPHGSYIGDSSIAYYLVVKRGIAPIKSQSKHCVCSIGFCEREQKWYGWSHRTICGFGIGDRIYEEGYGNDDTPFIKRGRKKIKTMRDAKLAAKRFARSVS
jgi:hypothetical protein